MDIVEGYNEDEAYLQRLRKMADDEKSDDDITGGYAYSWYGKANCLC